jgi:5'-nucleotidase
MNQMMMKRAAAIAAILATFLARPGAAPRALPPAAAQQDEASAPRTRAPLTILQVNDVYSTLPVDGAGGLARVATLKKQLAAAGRTPLLLLAGDFLSPSVASSVFKGEQMVAALNAAGLDMATLGNHEFDFGDDLLIQRMRETRWTWVVSNVIDTRTGKPIGGAAPYAIRRFGAMTVGFIGLCLNTDEISREKLTHTRLLDPMATAGTYLPILKREGATVVVAITHLAFADDRALAARFPQIDVIIGGHEHYPITTIEGRTLISKAGSDAKWVARIDVDQRRSGAVRRVERFYELIPITGALADEPATAAVVKTYEDRLGTALDVVVGSTSAPLDADSIRLRAGETNLGDFFADAIRADAGADIAIMNAGSIRGDRVYPAGPLTRRTLLAMHPFESVVCKIALAGRVVLEALEHGVSKLPATAGQFPQVSGLTMRVDASAPPGKRVRDLVVQGKALDLNRSYTLAAPDFMLKGGDGYSMLAGQRVLVGPETGDLVPAALEKAVAAAKVIAPVAEGRIVIR